MADPMNGASLDKFRRICGMLGSEHDGERANAARLATALLKQNGKMWSDVGLDGDLAKPLSDVVAARASAESARADYYKVMLNDANERTRRLTSERDKLARQVKTLELKLAEQATGVPAAELRKREKAERQAAKEARLADQVRQAQERAAVGPRSDAPGDAEMREDIEEALTRDLPPRTRDFLASVYAQKAWTFKQREAVRKALLWALRDG